jgi:hypothetical protein
MTTSPASSDAILAILDGWFKHQNSTDLTYMASFPPDGYGMEKGERMRFDLARHVATSLAAPSSRK